MVRPSLLALAAVCQSALAKKVKYTFDIGWVTCAPDGFSRPCIGINGKWPIPTIQANVGDEITVVANNKLGNQTTSLHWHGIRQFHTNQMDGPSGVAQCPIPPGSSYTYSFVVDTPGTYWYHSHNMGQYPDGLRAPLIVRDPKASYVGKVAKEYDLVLSDWYHKQTVDIIKAFQTPTTGVPSTPNPDSIIMNDGQSIDYAVETGKTYLFRIYNIGAFPSFFVNFQGLDMSVIGVDGVATKPTPAKTLYVGAAQRYDVLVTAKNISTANSAILALVDTSMFETPYGGNTSILGKLVYSKTASAPPPYEGLPNSILPPTDDMTIKPLDGQKLLGPVDRQIVLNFNQGLIDNIPRMLINGKTYLKQKVPSLFTAMTAPQNLKQNPIIYGENSNSFAIKFGETVEIVINNQTPTGHPWHLHGHDFQVVARGGPGSQGTYDPKNADPLPMKRDVAGVPSTGFVVFRFKADNPGIQLIHCHIEWHVEAGLTATILEATDKINSVDFKDKDRVQITHGLDAIKNCIIQKTPILGNAAGNFVNYTDLTGANTEVPQRNLGATYTPAKFARSRVFADGFES
ncbi:putative urea active transporter 1 [Venturia inaequalis]|nr:putative urea active transporter 1 [Venturia inaequalis]